VFGSLDYIYIPTADVDGEVMRYVETMGAELVWKVRAMGTTVACLGVGEPGPAILLFGLLPWIISNIDSGDDLRPFT